MRLSFALLAIVLLFAGPAAAVEPDEMLDDPKLEQRAREISAEVRCLVCQNQSIDESNAKLAADLRVLIRERLKAGDTNEEVFDFLVARYGEFVLLDPPVKPKTYVLWYGPAVLVVLGAVGIAVYFRRRRANAATASGGRLSREETERLQRILEHGDEAT